MEVKQIEGFHGLPREYVAISIEQQAIHQSTKDYEWLGHGVYFFKYIDDAKWWVSHKRYKDRETAILQATLTYSSSQLLDLDDPKEQETITKVFLEAIQRADDSIKLSETATTYQKWCFACNLIRTMQPQIGIIIFTFPVEQKKENVLFPKNRCQICVSDESIISNIREATL